MTNFNLHPQLESDCITLGDLKFCRVLLMNNRHFPWLVLVPMRENMRELFDLKPSDYQVVMSEVHETAKLFAKLTNADKINIAALGNRVPQLHIHIIARYQTDPAWPQPVWNCPLPEEKYAGNSLEEMVGKLKPAIGNITKM